MRTVIKISLKGGKRLLKAIYESLVPDNVDIPNGMDIDMELSNGFLIMEISGDERVKTDTLISTLDEILEACSMIEKVMEEAKNVRP